LEIVLFELETEIFQLEIRTLQLENEIFESEIGVG
jgi:hypothetical protein